MERSNDFLKLKSQELEKKLSQEQEARQTAFQKSQKLQNQVSVLEKGMRDLQSLSLAASQSMPRNFETERTKLVSNQERPLEVVDLNASQTREGYQKGVINIIGERNESLDDENERPENRITQSKINKVKPF